ncbi:alpha-galactosidase [Agromyces atrinae]|uniref:alpha-galactosidase n=1 Tax=Agromyces atrinae TaxID=592376 RepID=UPI001F5AAFBE|nr:alpha-galactosidase [Agromyces atrinae]MCI2956920.1 alpha-galactosidase [Agromyces atrinae]
MIQYLRASGVSLIIDARPGTTPAVLHWGRDLGDLDEAALAAFADSVAASVPPSAIDEPLRLTLLPSFADGWSGRPAIEYSAPTGWARTGDVAEGAVEFGPLDATTDIELTPEGVLRVRHRLQNTSDVSVGLHAASVVLPVPARARELLDFSGLWAHERRPQRIRPGHGVWSRESRHGRPGHDDPYLVVAGTPGFGFESGEVWATHIAWSGDRVQWFERSSLGPTTLGGGELLAPGELTLAPGEQYTSPWVVGVWSETGLDGVSDRLHPWIRSWSTIDRPRPLMLNTWEAVYFEHSLEGLQPLIDAAARVGVERFVLDDGWFVGRNDDRTSLGDWFVDETKWPGGLSPLIEKVHAGGMEFGLWFEPEMVSPESELARTHPDWILSDVRASTWRHQHVLDLANPEVFDYIFGRLDALLGEYAIAYVKWDHNRDVLAPGAHAQTAALYRLIDAVRAAHPGVEIESCASGGARIDLGILPRTDRVWTSDTNDPLERQLIQRYSSLLVPPEYLGGHLGDARAHTTGRTSSLAFRLATAFFGSAGIEWDLTEATDAELDVITAWATAYRERRALLHSGRVVRADAADEATLVHGVVAPDRSAGLFASVLLAAPEAALPPAVRLPGLDPERTYRVSVLEFGAETPRIDNSQPTWFTEGVTLRGSVLGEVGLPPLLMAPENAVLLEAVAIDA